jgi:hypothetical protein
MEKELEQLRQTANEMEKNTVELSVVKTQNEQLHSKIAEYQVWKTE